MRLLVVRHAVAMDRAEHALIQSDDSLRPLTDEGAKRMRPAARGLASLVATPDLLLTSPFERAKATAVILRACAWPNVALCERAELEPGAPVEATLAVVRGRAKSAPRDCVAIVGHEPHLSSFVSWLVTGRERSIVTLKKGGACLLEFDAGVEAGRARLAWSLPPKALRALGRR